MGLVRWASVLVLVLLAGREGPVNGRAQAPPTSDSASGALQRGLTLMETRGDCAAALPHFDDAVRRGDGTIAPRALFARGQCLERLGRPSEAREAYRRVAEGHPSHTLAPVADRHARRLAPAPRPPARSGPVLRQLPHDAGPSGSLSANGRYLFHRDDEMRPVRVDLTTGVTQRLQLGADEDDHFAGVPFVASATGQYLAYPWKGVDRACDVRVLDTFTGRSRVVYGDAAVPLARPVAFAPDGRHLFVLATDRAFAVSLIRVALDDARAVVRLAEFGVNEPFGVTVSPDGRHITFDHGTNAGPRDVFILDVDTHVSRPLVSHAADDMMPTWMPDGRAVLFVSDRLGPLSLWRQALERGAASGAPVLIRRDIGRIWPIGMSQAGSWVHAVQTGLVDVYTARLDGHGKVVEMPAPVSTQFAGANVTAEWSNDGAQLAYVAQRGATSIGAGSRALVIRETASGSERVLRPNLLFYNGPRWTHDGRAILLKGRGPANRWGLYLVDVRSGEVATVLTAEDVNAESDLGAYQWVPGRNAILMYRHGVGIVEIDADTAHERLVEPIPAGSRVTAGRGCGYAPDGRRLAYTVFSGKGQEQAVVLRVRDDQGTTHDVLRVQAPQWLAMQAWDPDGRAVYVLRNMGSGNGTERPQLWRVPLDGSPPTFTGLEAQSLRGVSVHPDGRTLAYISGYAVWETWVLENITPVR